MVKCFYCGESFDANAEPFIKPNSRRYAHKECAEDAEAKKTKEERDKEALEEYIKKLFGIEALTPKINRQIKDYREKNNYSYSGIYKALKYSFEVRGNSIEKANGGIGIVGYVYDQSNLYYRALWEAQQKNEDIKIEKYVLPVREVRIPIPDRKFMVPPRKRFSFLGGIDE